MRADEKVELLNDILEDSKRFEFVEDEILKISSYSDSRKRVYINFIGLLETIYEKLDDEDINRILLVDYEEE